MDAVVEVNVGSGSERQLCTWALELKTGKVTRILLLLLLLLLLPMNDALLTVCSQEYSIAHRSQAILYSLMMCDVQVLLLLLLLLLLLQT